MMKKQNKHLSSSHKSAPFLEQFLADTYVLYVKTQNFHWNVVDSRFYSLHKMFEGQYEELAEAIDVIAEQLRTLNCKAPASMKQFLKLSQIKEAEGSFSGDAMIKLLYEDHLTLVRWLPSKIEQTTSWHDHGTADLFIDRLRAHEKTSWILHSHFNS